MSRDCRWPLAIAVALVGVFMIARTPVVQGEGEEAVATDTAALLKRIAALEVKVAALEKRPPIVVMQQEAKPVAEVPKNWGSTQFNGQTIYFVPLTGGSGAQQKLPAVPAFRNQAPAAAE